MRIQIVIPLLLVWALVACNNNAPQKSEFDRQMDRAMELAQCFGPTCSGIRRTASPARMCGDDCKS